MGLTLVSRLAMIEAVPLSTRAKLMDFSAGMVLQFAAHLVDTADGLVHHGAFVNGTVALKSCCKWSRANGWTTMAHVETLQALEAFPQHPKKAAVLALHRRFVDAMLAVQVRLNTTPVRCLKTFPECVSVSWRRQASPLTTRTEGPHGAWVRRYT